MTSFRRILVQIWKVKFHKVKLLKLWPKTLLKLVIFPLWKSYEIKKKSSVTYLEPEGQGRGIIMGVTRLLLLGPFYYIHVICQPKHFHRQWYVIRNLEKIMQKIWQNWTWIEFIQWLLTLSACILADHDPFDRWPE